MEEIEADDPNIEKVVEDLAAEGYIIFEEVEEELGLEYKFIDGNVDSSNDNNTAYWISPNITNTQLNHNALKLPAIDR